MDEDKIGWKKIASDMKQEKSIGFLSKGKHLCLVNAFLASTLTFISHQNVCWPVFGWIYSPEKNCNELAASVWDEKTTTGKEDEENDDDDDDKLL